jgi:hypothetical protein
MTRKETARHMTYLHLKNSEWRRTDGDKGTEGGREKKEEGEKGRTEGRKEERKKEKKERKKEKVECPTLSGPTQRLIHVSSKESSGS